MHKKIIIMLLLLSPFSSFASVVDFSISPVDGISTPYKGLSTLNAGVDSSIISSLSNFLVGWDDVGVTTAYYDFSETNDCSSPINDGTLFFPSTIDPTYGQGSIYFSADSLSTYPAGVSSIHLYLYDVTSALIADYCIDPTLSTSVAGFDYFPIAFVASATTSTSTTATSTIEQTQNNTTAGIFLFLATMFLTLWIFKKR